MPLRILPASEKRKARRGQFRTAKKYVPDVAKTAQHPHSKLKTQKELKKITDSGAYKKSDYKGKTAMLGGKSYARGGKAGTGPTPGQRIKARKSRAREWWTGRGGPEGTEGDKSGVYNPILDKKLREKRPHSSPEGRMRDVKKAYAEGAKRKDAPWKKKRLARTSKAVGGVIKKIISKVKPKGKDERFWDFIKTGKAVDKHGVKVNVPKAAERLTGRPHVDHGKRKRIKHLGKGKASGGRAGFQHGGRTRLLEELGRVEAEPSNRNRRAEISRVHGELNRGYKSGGAVLKGKKVGIQIK